MLIRVLSAETPMLSQCQTRTRNVGEKLRCDGGVFWKTTLAEQHRSVITAQDLMRLRKKQSCPHRKDRINVFLAITANKTLPNSPHEFIVQPTPVTLNHG